jgi:hypothetical protein
LTILEGISTKPDVIRISPRRKISMKDKATADNYPSSLHKQELDRSLSMMKIIIEKRIREALNLRILPNGYQQKT